MIYFSKKTGLRIVMKPEKRFRDKHDNPVLLEGVSLRFVNGKFETKDADQIKYMKKYMEEWPGEITVVDPVKIERDRRIHELAKELIDQEDQKGIEAVLKEESSILKKEREETEKENEKIKAEQEKKYKEELKAIANAKKNDKEYSEKKDTDLKKKFKEKLAVDKKKNDESDKVRKEANK